MTKLVLNKTAMKQFANTVIRGMKKYAPEMSITMGTIGLCMCIPLAAKEALECDTIIKEAKKDSKMDKLAPQETIKLCWKTCAPCGVLSILSIGAIFEGSKINLSRRMALTAACGVAQKALYEYKDAAKAVLGDTKERAISAKQSENAIKKAAIKDENVEAMKSSDLNSMIFEPITGRLVQTSIDKVLRAKNYLNSNMIRSGDFVSLNDFFYEIGAPEVDERYGGNIGWRHNSNSVFGNDDGLIDLHMDSVLLHRDDYPWLSEDKACIAIAYDVYPTTNIPWD